MDDWRRTLRRAGVPIGAPTAEPTRLPSRHELARAIAAVVDRGTPNEREALVAWLDGFRHHWPIRFARLVGAAGEAVLDATSLEAARFDPGRHVKLRRIAIARLASAG